MSDLQEILLSFYLKNHKSSIDFYSATKHTVRGNDVWRVAGGEWNWLELNCWNW